jgi:hypothetical protein
LISDLQDLGVELAVQYISNTDRRRFNIYLLHQLKPLSTSLTIEIRSISASECVHVRLAVEGREEA